VDPRVNSHEHLNFDEKDADAELKEEGDGRWKERFEELKNNLGDRGNDEDDSKGVRVVYVLVDGAPSRSCSFR
jgi:hypothetical protein